MYPHVDKIIAFQFIQETVDRLELRLKTNLFHERDRDRLRADLVDRFGTSVKIDIIQEVDFVQVGEGKTPVIVSKVKNALF
jgi:preprotein translocase subunit SecA